MKFTVSLRKNSDFRYVYDHGETKANRLLVIYYIKNDNDLNRLGITVSKKVGNSVVRSRVKRLIKENYRLAEHSVACGYDIIVLARVGSADTTFEDINKALCSLFNYAGIIKND